MAPRSPYEALRSPCYSIWEFLQRLGLPVWLSGAPIAFKTPYIVFKDPYCTQKSLYGVQEPL